ncbi:hypothetical protein DsansV1_C19g0161121 [Dioscorea sansibarensis]
MRKYFKGTFVITGGYNRKEEKENPERYTTELIRRDSPGKLSVHNLETGQLSINRARLLLIKFIELFLSLSDISSTE